MTFIERPTTWAIVFFICGLVLLFIAVRGLLGFSIIMPTKFSGLKRFTGREARVAGGLTLFFALLWIVFGFLILRQ